MVNGNVLLHLHSAVSADNSLEGRWPSLLIGCCSSAALSVGVSQLQCLYRNSWQLLGLYVGCLQCQRRAAVFQPEKIYSLKIRRLGRASINDAGFIPN